MPKIDKSKSKVTSKQLDHSQLREPLKKQLNRGMLPGTASMDMKHWEYLVSCITLRAQAIKDGKPEDEDVEFVAQHALGRDVNINGVSLVTDDNEFSTLINCAYEKLFIAYKSGNRSRAAQPLAALLKKIRAAAELVGVAKTTKITQTRDIGTGYGTGVVAEPLTFLPDPNMIVGNKWSEFGSSPDANVVGIQAPTWKVLSRRRHESQSNPPAYGNGTHYILGHLINDNLNGSGADAGNLTPLWSTANKQMAKQVEAQVKDAVLKGFDVRFEITPGPRKGDRSAVLDLVLEAYGKKTKNELPAEGKLKYEIVEAEENLLKSLTVTYSAKDSRGVPATGIVVVENYIPDTIPELTGTSLAARKKS